MKILWMILGLCVLPLFLVAQTAPSTVNGRDQGKSATPEERQVNDGDVNNKRQVVEVQPGAPRNFNQQPKPNVVQDTLYVQHKAGERMRLDLSGYSVRPVVIVLPPDESEQPVKRDDE